MTRTTSQNCDRYSGSKYKKQLVMAISCFFVLLILSPAGQSLPDAQALDSMQKATTTLPSELAL